MSDQYDENKRKHFDYLQSIITRMNSNSFMIKGWAITIVSALLAWAVSAKNELLVVVSLVPIILFWWLDAKFLQTERKFRCLYEEAIKENSTVALYDLKINQTFIEENIHNKFWQVFKSDTLKLFYGLLAFVCLIPVIIIRQNKSSKEPLKIEGSINVEIPKPIHTRTVK